MATTTRDVEFFETLDHQWFFILRDHGQEVMISDPYSNRADCFKEGIETLDYLHETRPNKNEETYTWMNNS